MLKKLLSMKEYEAFMMNVYAQSRRKEVEKWGWADSEIREFLTMQFQIMMRSYKLQYPDLESRIIYGDQEPAGYMQLSKNDHGITLVSIMLLLHFQGKGLGTKVIRQLQAEARQHQCPIRLSVQADNPAQRLYSRLGFQVVDQNSTYLSMEWRDGERRD